MNTDTQCTEEGCKEPRKQVTQRNAGGKEYSYLRETCSFHHGRKTAAAMNGGVAPSIGDIKINDEGYIYEYTDSASTRDGRLYCGWERQHKLRMEQELGRLLVRGVESVHHINGDRADNRIENLELWVGGVRYGQRASEIICPHCGKSYADRAAKMIT